MNLFRFERQAREWGGSYKFRSCADVRLVASLGDSERCSNQGTWDGASCQCNRCDQLRHIIMTEWEFGICPLLEIVFIDRH